jgi:hypothetical protein
VIGVALGVALGLIALGVLHAVYDRAMADAEGPPVPEARDARLRERLAQGPCFVDRRGRVRRGLRRWTWR